MKFLCAEMYRENLVIIIFGEGERTRVFWLKSLMDLQNMKKKKLFS